MSLDRSLGTAMLAATALAVAGCLNVNDSSPEPASSDEEGIQNVIFQEMSDYTDTDVRWYDEDSDAANAPVNTRRWLRQVLSFDKTFAVQLDRRNSAQPTALVTVVGEATGILHLWALEAEEIAHYMKDFSDKGTRTMLLERVRRRDRPAELHGGWKLLAMSGVHIASPGTTRHIRSVRIQSAGVDETITGVGELVRIEDLLRLPADAEVSLTVDTGDATDAVFLHLRHLGRRVQLDGNGDGTFTRTIRTGGRPGPRHFVIDVLSHGSIYDTEEAYDNVAWGIPCLVGVDVDVDNGGVNAS